MITPFIVDQVFALIDAGLDKPDILDQILISPEELDEIWDEWHEDTLP